MKRTFTISILLMFVLSFSACSKKAAKLYDKGDYSQAFSKSLAKIQGNKKKVSAEDVKLLEQSYHKLLENDQVKIASWEESGSPDRWENIWRAYSRIQDRQDRIRRRIPIEAGNYRANFTFVDVQDKLEAAKEEAAFVIYEKGMRFLNTFEQTGSKDDARSAHDYFQQANRLYPGIGDAETLILETLELGTTYVLIDFANTSTRYLPYGFQLELDREIQQNDRKWIKYDESYIEGIDYDYRIQLTLYNVDVEPEREDRDTETYVRTIQEFARNASGGYVTDTAGNRITEDVEIRARVTNTTRTKSAALEFDFSIYDEQDNDLLERRQFFGDSRFRSVTCDIRGDERALPNNYDCNERNPVRFPSDEEMLEDAFDDFRSQLRSRMNSGYID
ncbi:MAG: hypothetical protein KTR13_00020 [Saprospiraceae bacterium]|nr:hypothetical protein [Saprospiraceae bacterium]